MDRRVVDMCAATVVEVGAFVLVNSPGSRNHITGFDHSTRGGLLRYVHNRRGRNPGVWCVRAVSRVHITHATHARKGEGACQQSKERKPAENR